MTLLDNEADSQPTKACHLPVALGSWSQCKFHTYLGRYAFPRKANARLSAPVDVNDFSISSSTSTVAVTNRSS